MGTSDREVICTLAAAEVPDRLEDWRQLMARAARTERTAGRIQAAFSFVELPNVRRLVAAEASCCAFLDFSIDTSGDLVELTVGSADPNAQPVLDALFAAPA